ncbi:STAS domain-containing protein [Pseudanabaena sp. PCC 6802]|uniref:STAS domain-containing protein n=1 Tax=Pseudanabaena sp. PCC 6802 TaxID=118173 RepID=UPI00034B5865|nr:STAS domain-containing protein [Pseudanabaena sp. PCC 6802]
MSSEVEIIKPSGRLDVTSAAKFRHEVTELAATKPRFLLVDLENVSFMDSSGLGALVSALKTIRSVNGELAVCSLSEQVKMLFDLTSMSKIFIIYANQGEFYSKVGLSRS